MRTDFWGFVSGEDFAPHRTTIYIESKSFHLCVLAFYKAFSKEGKVLWTQQWFLNSLGVKRREILWFFRFFFFLVSCSEVWILTCFVFNICFKSVNSCVIFVLPIFWSFFSCYIYVYTHVCIYIYIYIWMDMYRKHACKMYTLRYMWE